MHYSIFIGVWYRNEENLFLNVGFSDKKKVLLFSFETNQVISEVYIVEGEKSLYNEIIQ